MLNKVEEWYPLVSLNFETLTERLTILYVLGTAHRAQIFSLIKLENIVQSSKIQITGLITTSRRNACQPLLKLSFFPGNPNLCIASTLERYLAVTRRLRHEDCNSLLITTRSPYKKATTQTI